MFLDSLRYHPFGLFIFALFIFIALQSLWPRNIRKRIIQFMERHARWFNGLYVLFVGTFVGFGVARALLHFAHDGLPLVR